MATEPVHWSKDFVEHLRTVHFTLIALCIGLIVLASFPSKSEIQLAHEQASEILGVINTWDNTLLESEALKVLNANLTDYDRTEFIVTNGQNISAQFTLRPDRGPIQFRPAFISPSWLIKLDLPPELVPDASDASGPALLISKPAAIRSFQRLWDAFLVQGNIVIPHIPNECLLITVRENLTDSPYVETEKCTILSLDPVESPHIQFAPFELHLRNKYIDQASKIPNPKWDYELSYFVQYEEGGRPTRNGLILPVRSVKQIPIDGLNALIRLSDKWNKKHGLSFKDAFPELASVDAPFENADVLSATRILDAESRRTGDAFEAAGLKIPAEIAVRCGVLLILGVQLYLWIHLHEFGNRLEREAGFDVAWIGVYSSWPAKAMLFASVILLPISTVILLSYRGLGMTEHRRLAWSILVISNVASLLISYFVFKALPESPSAKNSNQTTLQADDDLDNS